MAHLYILRYDARYVCVANIKPHSHCVSSFRVFVPVQYLVQCPNETCAIKIVSDYLLSHSVPIGTEKRNGGKDPETTNGKRSKYEE